MPERIEVRDGKEFVVKVLPSDRRLTPSEQKRRVTGSDLVRQCPKCKKMKIPWKDAMKSRGKKWCSECRRRWKEQRG